jgi:antitoxin MazE
MSLTIAKWGNSLAVRLPKVFTEALQWDENTEVVPSIVDGKLILEIVHDTEYQLDDLVARISAENMHQETDTGGIIGNEVW